jgi:hypothetical protein
MDNLAKSDLIFNEFNDLNVEGLNLLKFDSDGILIPKKVEYTIRKYFFHPFFRRAELPEM